MIQLERPRPLHGFAVLLATIGYLAPWAHHDPMYTGPDYLMIHPETGWGLHGTQVLTFLLCYLVLVSVVRFSFDERRSVTRLTGVATGIFFAVRGTNTVRRLLPDGVTYSPANRTYTLAQAELTPGYGLYLLVAGGVALVIVNVFYLWADADE